MTKTIDFRSDTATKPTDEMRKAMAEAEVGDDVLQEDPTVNRLEALGAEMTGKEASIFVPSGTFGNQLALFTLCERRDEVILSEYSHIVQHEAAASSVIAGVQLRTILPGNGYITWEQIDRRIRRGKDVHFPRTGCISLENALSSGAVHPLSGMREVKRGAEQFGIPVHLDGARIFNAAAAAGVEASDIAAQCDTVMFCLSKGLAAPVGSLLAGDKGVIEKARFMRKVMGGGMRQAGILAAAGIIALEKMARRLHVDHLHARRIGEALNAYDLFDVDLDEIQINMVFVNFTGDNLLDKQVRFTDLLKEKGFITYPPKYGGIRLVTHNDVSEQDVDYFISVLPEIAEKMAAVI